MVAADSSGMAITFTSTINLIFGSQLMVPETGIIMNNEMNGMYRLIPARTADPLRYLSTPTNMPQISRYPVNQTSSAMFLLHPISFVQRSALYPL